MASVWLLIPAAMLEITQQAYLLTTFLWCSSTFSSGLRIPAASSLFVCSAVPVEMLPSIRIDGTKRGIVDSSRFLMILGITSESTTTWILFLFASEWEEIAQQQSARISLSVTLDLAIALHNTGIADLIRSYFGRGLPLQRLLRAQQPCLMSVSSVVLSTTSTRLMSPPDLIIVSL